MPWRYTGDIDRRLDYLELHSDILLGNDYGVGELTEPSNRAFRNRLKNQKSVVSKCTKVVGMLFYYICVCY